MILQRYCCFIFMLFIYISDGLVESYGTEEIQKEYIAEYQHTLVIDCKFKSEASSEVVHSVRLSTDNSKVLAFANNDPKVHVTDNYKELGAKLTMGIERRTGKHLRIYIEQLPRALNNVAVMCYSTGQQGMGKHETVIKNVIRLMQSPKIQNDSFPSMITLKEGQLSVPNVTCNATALPRPVLDWLAPDERLLMTSDNKRSKNGKGLNRMLTLPLPKGPVSRAMSGKYTCVARFSSDDQRRVSQNPQDKKHVLIRVHYKPKIIVREKIVYSDVGVEEIVKMNVDGNPEPEVRCTLKNMPRTRVASVTRHGHQVFHSLNIRVGTSDVGNYVCNASNYMGYATTFFKLTITPPTPTILSEGGPTIYSDYYKLRLESESKARLRNATALMEVKQNGTYVPIRTFTRRLTENGFFNFHLPNLTHDTEHQVRARICSHHACSEFTAPHTFRTRYDAEGSYTVHPSVYRVRPISEGSRSGPPGGTSTNRALSTLLVFMMLLVFCCTR